MTADHRALLVHKAFERSLTVVPLDRLEEDSRWPTAPRTAPPWHRGHVDYGTVDPYDDVLAGRWLFFSGSDSEVSRSRSDVTCATCHPDGRNDNRSWAFIDGPRNTPSLAGAGDGHGLATETAPLHWRGELASPADLQRTVTEFMGGSGLSDRQLGQLTAFLDSIPPPDMGDPASEQEAELVRRGAEVFNSVEVGCATCHAGAHFTDNVNHNVGTAAREDEAPGDFQTPVLRGLLLKPPFLHDGSANTLEEVVDRLVRTDKMGHGSTLPEADLAALVAYLKTL